MIARRRFSRKSYAGMENFAASVFSIMDKASCRNIESMVQEEEASSIATAISREGDYKKLGEANSTTGS